MGNPLDSLRSLAVAPADAVRWACVLEATAAKPGNVYPGRPFDDLTHADFIRAGEIASDWFGRQELRISERVLGAAQENQDVLGTNVNLGILLLLGPLVAADELSESLAGENWSRAISRVLGGLEGPDAQNIYRAIRVSTAGGLGKAEQWDINQHQPPIDIVEAMSLAQSYDRIAKQYATGFADLINHVVPVLSRAIDDGGDLLGGIVRAHVILLRLEPDSLIARKNGASVAQQIQQRARAVDLEDPASVAEFDDSLRGDGHRLNPGTTADLIAAALYVLLRTPN